MNDHEQLAQWEQALIETARAYQYPPTPDLAVSLQRRNAPPARPVVAQRRMPTWAVALGVVLAVLVLGGLAVPQSRAAILTLVARIGAIRVFMDESQPTTTATPLPLLAPPQTSTLSTPTPIPLALLAAAPGDPIPLAALADSADFPVRVPPATGPWGSPDSAVAHMVAGHSLITLVWEREGRPVLTLTQTDIPQLAAKMAGAGQMEAVMIGDLDGLWVAGPHTLQWPIEGGPDQVQIAGNVLLWSDGAMTYRIEGDISRDDAVRLAESLSPAAAP